MSVLRSSLLRRMDRSEADLSAGSMEDLSAGIVAEIPSSAKAEAGNIYDLEIN